MNQKADNIFEYIKVQVSNYERPVPVGTKEWSMKSHIERSTLYRDSDIVGPKTKFTVIKNITRPVLNISYRAEDIDVKDVQIYCDDKDKYYLSFLVQKYHDDVFVHENHVDTFFDKLNRSRIDYGGGLSKRLKNGREVVPLQSIAFCDQTDILSGPIGIKHYFSPDQLLAMGERGWGKESNGATITLNELIKLSREEKKENNNTDTATTPGRYIEIFEVHGNLPVRYYDKTDTSGNYETRLFIVAMYQKRGEMQDSGVILYTAPETENPFKLALRETGTFGRALDFGGAEELFEDQMWTNYAEIRKIQIIDSASKTILGATGPNSISIANKSNINNLENNEILDLGDGDLKQIDTFPRNFRLFDTYSAEKDEHAKTIGAAQDPLQGHEPTAGTPFSSLQAQIQQGMGLHEYRRGIFAKHIEEIYRDDYIPQIAKAITEGVEFLAELSLDELQYVTECIVRNTTNERITEMVLAGETPTQDEMELLKDLIREDFKKKGNKHFISILKDRMKGIKLNVKVSVAGKSKNLANMADKVSGLVRFVMSTFNPQTGGFTALDDPRIAKWVNQINELSGLDPIDFTPPANKPQSMAQPMTPSPIKAQLPQPAYGQ